MRKFSLERHRLFPYIAWITITAFAVFVGYLATELKQSMQGLEDRTSQLEKAVSEMQLEL